MILNFLKLNFSLIKFSIKPSRNLSNSIQNLFSNDIKNCTHLLDSHDPEMMKVMQSFMIVKQDFISEQEENSLLAEVDPYMKRLRYEFDHWDNVILLSVVNFSLSFLLRRSMAIGKLSA